MSEFITSEKQEFDAVAAKYGMNPDDPLVAGLYECGMSAGQLEELCIARQLQEVGKFDRRLQRMIDDVASVFEVSL